MKTIDLHCDTVLSLLEDEQRGITPNPLCNTHHIDLKKLEQADSYVQTFALFTDRKLLDIPEQQAMRLYDMYCRMLEEYSDRIAPVYKFEDIENNRKAGKLSALLSLEDGGVCFSDLAMLRNWYRMGVRMIALTWNYANGIGYPNFEMGKEEDYHFGSQNLTLDCENGLTEFGIQYVQEMERLGMIVDVSHLSDKGFWDVLENTKKPFIASHSNARSLCPVPRNLSDEMILALAKRGGVMGMNFCADFLHTRNDNKTTIDDIIQHILYIRNLAGVDVIALGSDFDGIGCQMEFENAAGLSMLKQALFEAGLSEEEIEKIFYKNALRVMKAVLQ